MSIRPLSLWESHESTGEISLRELFDNHHLDIDGRTSEMGLEDLIFAACRGGWPGAISLRSRKEQLEVARDFVRSVCLEDISRIDGKKRSEELAVRILCSYARHISDYASDRALLADVTAPGDVRCSMDTFDDYTGAMRRLFVIQDIDAWCPPVRSRTAIRRSVRRGFCDPSVAAAILGLSPEDLEVRMKTFGLIFLQMCIRDLKAYTAGAGGHISCFHDRYGLEADIVLHLEDGRYALVQCRPGSLGAAEGARDLLEIRSLIRKHNTEERQMPVREPDLLIVLTCGEMAITGSDWVKVIPLACLRD
ncbi:MAG: DUF4143 domain-containing protein [Succinivibrionaceae bacterium]|nr:DUF4143 domain-containing protein [Succinivibrionaceae bacterium]